MNKIKKFFILSLFALIALMISCGSEIELKEYTVEFYIENIIYDTQKVISGSKLNKPTDPIKEEYVFDGWYIDGEKWLFSSGLVVSDMKLEAVFTEENDKPVEGVEPVYQGMSIEGSNTYKMNRKNKGNFKESIDDILGVVTTEKVEYFAQKGEKFNIVVHLYNPSKYEILSFTLNDYKYQSFEFKEGSNSEQLIIEVDAGTVAGLKEYTIDAIKYVDGTDIKDVRMEGEKTVKAGIEYEIVPTGTIVSSEVGTTSFKLVVDIKDNNNLLNMSNGIYFFMFDGSNIISQKLLKLGINTIEINNLLMGSEYTYMVVGVYDNYSGSGKRANEIISDSVTTIDGFLLDKVESTQNSIILNMNKKDTTSNFKSISLYLDGQLVSEKNYSEKIVFDNLLSNTEYSVSLKYTYTNNGAEREKEVLVNVNTLEKTIPSVAINSLLANKNEITYNFDESDIDKTKTKVTVSLFNGLNKVGELDSLEDKFTDLLSNTNYKVVLNYEYDLNDGNGKNVITEEYEIKTDEKSKPVITINSLVGSKEEINFKFDKVDSDNTIKNVYVTLYLDSNKVNSISLLEGKFEKLLSSTNYKVVLTCEYDLNDGEGIQVITQDYECQTKDLAQPVINVTTSSTNNSIAYKTNITDVDNTLGKVIYSLYLDDTFIESSENSEYVFNDLFTNSKYTLIVKYDYDLNDGSDRSNELTFYSQTKSLSLPVLSYNNITSDRESVSYKFDKIDTDNTLVSTSVSIYQDINKIETIDSLEGKFSKLYSGTEYKIALTYEYNLKDGKGVQKIVQEYPCTTKSLTAPRFDVKTTTDKESVSYKSELIDVDNILKKVTYKLYQGEAFIASTENSEHKFTGLFSDNNYVLVVEYEYDLNNGEITKDELRIDAHTKAILAPIYTVDSMVSDRESIVFAIDENDVDNTRISYSVALYKDLNKIETVDELKGEFVNLYSGSNYRVVLTYKYDLNDGRGVLTSTQNYDVKTESLIMPEFDVTYYTSKDNISYKTNITDIDNTIKNVTYSLHLGDKLIESTSESEYEFNNLLSDSNYSIIIKYVYDMNDGKESVDEKTVYVQTKAKSLPMFIYNNVSADKNSLSFKFEETDVDNTKISSEVSLFKGEEKIGSINSLSGKFENLLSGVDYRLELSCKYDLNDGQGEKVVTQSYERTTSSYSSPKIDIEAETTKESFSYKTKITDVDDTLTKVFYKLYLGETYVESSELQETTFTNLKSNSNYTLVVEYEYNLNNGVITKDEVKVNLRTKAKTAPVYTISSAIADKKQISYKFALEDLDNTSLSYDIALYQGMYQVDTKDTLEGVFDDLYSGVEYKLVLTSKYDLNDGEGEKSEIKEFVIETKGLTVPKIDMSFTVDEKSLTYIANVINPDKTLNNVIYKLYQGDVYINASYENEYQFTDLKSNTEYKVVVEYSYDLENGKGQVNEVDEYFVVLGKEVPVFNLTPYLITDTEVEYNLLISDPNASGRLNMLALYQGMNFIVRLDETTSRIDGLHSNTDYTIKANYIYDFDDGLGSREINYEYKFRTLKENPTIELSIANVTKTSVEVNYDINDVDDALDLESIQLIHNGEVIREFNTLNQKLFEELLSDNSYVVKVIFNKDLNNGSEQISRSIEVSTLQKETPTVDIELTSTKTDVYYSYNINDNDKISSVKSVDIYYQGTKVDKDPIDNVFTGLYSDSEYTVVVTLLCDYNDGKESKEVTYEETIRTESHQIPSMDIELTSTVDTINYDLIKNDIYNLIKLNKINVYNEGNLVKEVTDFTSTKITGLESNTLYRVEVVYEYDLNDNNGKHISYVEKSYSTLAHDVLVVGYEVLNNGSPKTNEEISLNIKLENESKVELAYIVVNGEKKQISGGDMRNNIVIVMTAPKVSGLFSLKVEKMGYYLNGVEVEQKIESSNVIEIEIMSRLDVVSATTLNMSTLVSQYKEAGLMLIIDNPYGYIIESYTINDQEHKVLMIDNNHIYIPTYDVRYNQYLNIKKVVYKDANGNDTTRNYDQYFNMNLTILESSASKVEIISTPEDLMNIKSGHAYELANDIDMSGYNWMPSDFSGIIDGKGHTIKNLSMVYEYENAMLSCGLFRTFEGVLNNVYFENLYMSIDSESIYTQLLYGSGNPVIENVLVNGSLVLNYTGNCSLAIPNNNSLYVVDYLNVNGNKYDYVNTITTETFNSESFKLNTLGWDFTNKKYGNENGLLYTVYDNSYVFINGYEGTSSNVVIPDTINDLPVLGISDLAFANNDLIKTLEINENILFVGEEFINNCINLESLTLEGLNASLIYSIFNYGNFENLKELYIKSETNIENSYVSLDLTLDNLEKLYLDGVYFYMIRSENLYEIVIKNTYETGRFVQSKTLEKVTLENVKIISSEAFSSCTSLSNIQLCDEIEVINSSAFYNCKNLSNIEFNEKLERIESSAFNDCDSLTEVILPNSLVELGDSCFSNCDRIKTVILPNSLRTIRDWALCTHSMEYIIIPESVKDIGYMGVYAKNIYLCSESVPSRWDENALDGVFLYLNFRSLHTENNIEYILFNDNTAKVKKCNVLTGKVVIPNEVNYNGENYTITQISVDAFEYSEVSEVELPDTLKKIDYYAFNSCTKLSNIIIPISVEEIGANAFNEICSVYCEVDSRPSGWDENFAPSNLVTWNFNSFYSDSQFDYILFNDNTAITMKYNGSSLKVTIPNEINYKGVNYIVTELFTNTFGNSKITDVILPNKLKKIYPYTFNYCDGLINLIIPASVEIIGYEAINRNCTIYCEVDKKPLGWDETFNAISKVIWNFKSFYSDSNYEYVLFNDNTASIVKYIGSDNNLVISDNVTVNNVKYPITTIGANAFLNSNVVELTMPNTIKTIEAKAFYNSKVLTTIKLSNSLEYIGDQAFEKCSNLISIDLPDTLTYLGRYAFSKCYSLTTVKLSSSLKDIYEHAFSECSNLDSIIIPEGIESIGSNSFWACYVLSNVILPSTLKNIYHNAFGSCVKLNSIIIPNSVEYIESNAFGNGYSCNIYCQIYSKPDEWNDNWCNDSNCEVLWNFNTMYTYNGVEYAIFNNNKASVNKYVGTGKEVTILGEITYNGKKYVVNEISPRAFTNSNVEKVIISEGVTKIADEAFYQTGELRTVVLPNSLVEIGSNAFTNSLLLGIVIPENVQKIGKWAFGNGQCCVIYCEAASKPIGWNSEWNHANVCSVVWGFDANYSDINYDYVLYKDNTATITKYKGSDMNLVVPEIVTYNGNDYIITKIGQNAFESNNNLYLVKLPETIISIGQYAFNNCYNLINIDFPNGLVEIGCFAFSGCILNNVVIPSSVETIEDCVFMNGYAYYVYCEIASRPSGWDINWCCNKEENYVIWNYKETYIDGLNEYILFNDNTAMITKYNLNVTNVVINETIMCDEINYTITGIGKEAFKNSKMTSIKLPDTIKTIKEYAFYNCNSLEKIVIPEGVTKISQYTFSDCVNLVEVTLPSMLIKIEQAAFNSCNSLSKIELPSSLKQIDHIVFNACYNLEIYIPNTVIKIDELAFYNHYGKIYCEATSKPLGWKENWCDSSSEVIWGSSK